MSNKKSYKQKHTFFIQDGGVCLQFVGYNTILIPSPEYFSFTSSLASQPLTLDIFLSPIDPSFEILHPLLMFDKTIVSTI